MEWKNSYNFYLEILGDCSHYAIDFVNSISLVGELLEFTISHFWCKVGRGVQRAFVAKIVLYKYDASGTMFLDHCTRYSTVDLR